MGAGWGRLLMFPSPSLCSSPLTLKSLDGAWELPAADGAGCASLMELSEKRRTDTDWRLTLSPSEDSPPPNCLKSY